MTSVPFSIHHGAFSGYTTLTPEERVAIQAAIDPLVDRPEEEWTAHGAIRLGSPEPFYLLKIDPSLRAIVQPTSGGRPELLDLVRHETLEFMFGNQDPLSTQTSTAPSVK
ncbi:MAG TPA: hypothetical protein VKA15_16300 [Isosphaeraceae bacterium]|nr:hypothetical protein [Isosphaeraceae bacterium]